MIELRHSLRTGQGVAEPTASTPRASVLDIGIGWVGPRQRPKRLIGAVEREGMTLVPLKLNFNERGRAKIELALARGKKLYDKRETEKKRSWERERGRLLRQKG
jgi:SmpB protein